MKLIKKRIKDLQYLSPVKMIVLFYTLAIIISTAILNLPFLIEQGESLSIFDSLFMAISGISGTGLSVIQINETFNTGGYFALSFVIQLGGIGIMTMGTMIYIILGKKIGIRERQLISIDQNQATLSGLVRLMFKILQTIITIEIIGMIILSIHYLNYFDTWQEAWIQGYFASISATVNSGYDITGVSLIPFSEDYFVQIVQIILMVLGSIGFPVLIELQTWLVARGKARKQFRFTTFTKLATTTYFLLILLGVVMILFIEWDNYFKDFTWHNSFFKSFFISVSSRNAGLTTLDINQFSTPTLIVISFLMFIGASPSSVGGGIRTTTFAIVLLAIYNYAKGRQRIKIFKREISYEDMIRSFVVLTTALLLTLTAIFVLSITESFSIMELAFEVFSAFGTTGLSLGITADLSIIGRIVIMIMMFIGRIGIFSFLFLISSPPTKDLYRYPEARMLIG